MEDDPVDLAEDAYSQISSQLAAWSGDDTNDDTMDIESHRRKSLFTRAGFVRPPLSSPKLSDFKKSANPTQALAPSSTLALPPPPSDGNTNASSRPQLSESYHASLSTLLQSYSSDPSVALQSYFEMLSKGASDEGLHDEGNVWSLLHNLVQGGVEMLTSPNPPPDPSSPSPTFGEITGNVAATPEVVTQSVLTSDPRTFRRAIILHWLESCAAEHVVYVDPSVSHKKSKMWPDTLSSIRSSSSEAKGSFDPDTNHSLKGTDVIDEAELLSACLQFIRAGKLQEACDLCAKVRRGRGEWADTPDSRIILTQTTMSFATPRRDSRGGPRASQGGT